MTDLSDFQPVDTFSWNINRAERSQQARWLAPLLDQPEGRAWFLQALDWPGNLAEARTAETFHLCFPLRDIFTEDHRRCRGNPERERAFIAYYNEKKDQRRKY